MGDLLRKITINKFKGFGEIQSISFAVPNGQPGSGLTITVGENNTGKSSVQDAIKKLEPRARFFKKERFKGNSPEIDLTDKNGDVKKITKGKKATVCISGNNLIDISNFEFISSRRHWQHSFSSGNISTYSSYLSQMAIVRNKDSVDAYLGSLLETIVDDSNMKNEFDSMMKFLTPNFLDWHIDTDDAGNDYVEYKVTDGMSHDTSLVGDGIISLFRICAHLVSTNDDLILSVDEPELSLSPTVQKRLSKIFSKKSSNKQILINTHSPHFLNWNDISCGAMIYRTIKKKGRCEIKHLDTNKQSIQKILSGIDDWQKPHVLDYVAKEVFFADRVLFLEGQEDVGLIQKYIIDNGVDINFEIFGYGAGGSSNIPYFLELSKDLGIKAAALFDQGAPGLSDAKKFTEFKVKELGFPDIRTKNDKQGNVTKVGLFDYDGTINSQNKKVLSDILEEFTNFFN